jgi:hypothetical protein
MLKMAMRTFLACMPWVNLDDTNTTRLCFVLHKGVQLGKRPAMQAPLVVSLLARIFAASHLACLSNVLQVFQRDRRTCGGVLNNALGEYVIVVFMPPKLFARKLLEVSLGASGAFGLQLSFQSEATPFLFLPLPLPQEVTIGCDSRTVQAQVYPNDLLRELSGGWRDADYDMSL